MKRTMIKTISLIMVLILLITAFAACGNVMDGNKETTPPINPGQSPEEPDNKEEEQDDHTRVFTIGDLEPLLKETLDEIDAAWLKTHAMSIVRYGSEEEGGYVYLGDRYYGTYGDSIVIFCGKKSGYLMQGVIKVADEVLKCGHEFEIYVYNDGTFYGIYDAYAQGLLSQSDVCAIARYHYEFEFHEQNINRKCFTKYGSYEKCDVFLYEEAQNGAEKSITVAGYEFKLENASSIIAYAAGELREIDWLYENGYITSVEVAEIHKIHSEYVE